MTVTQTVDVVATLRPHGHSSRAAHRARPRVGHAHLDRLERRALLAGDFVSAFDFAPLAVAGAQAESAVTVDAAGNVIMAGAFAGATIDLDPSGGATNLVSTSGGDAYVAKYSQAGALVWARQIRSTSGGADEFAKGVDVATDAGGNVYVAGQFAGTAGGRVLAGIDGVNIGGASARGASGVRVTSTGPRTTPCSPSPSPRREGGFAAPARSNAYPHAGASYARIIIASDSPHPPTPQGL